jgi:hypothetical protein
MVASVHPGLERPDAATTKPVDDELNTSYLPFSHDGVAPAILTKDPGINVGGVLVVNVHFVSALVEEILLSHDPPVMVTDS